MKHFNVATMFDRERLRRQDVARAWVMLDAAPVPATDRYIQIDGVMYYIDAKGGYDWLCRMCNKPNAASAKVCQCGVTPRAGSGCKWCGGSQHARGAGCPALDHECSPASGGGVKNG